MRWRQGTGSSPSAPAAASWPWPPLGAGRGAWPAGGVGQKPPSRRLRLLGMQLRAWTQVRKCLRAALSAGRGLQGGSWQGTQQGAPGGPEQEQPHSATHLPHSGERPFHQAVESLAVALGFARGGAGSLRIRGGAAAVCVVGPFERCAAVARGAPSPQSFAWSNTVNRAKSDSQRPGQSAFSWCRDQAQPMAWQSQSAGQDEPAGRSSNCIGPMARSNVAVKGAVNEYPRAWYIAHGPFSMTNRHWRTVFSSLRPV
jgi:hypothetical protein